MAEPLRRRAFGPLRELRGPGAIALHADTVVASRSEGRSPLREPLGPRMEHPSWETGARPEPSSARVPWSRGAQEAAAPSRALVRASPGTEGSGEDGEDEGADYYENLPSGSAPEGAEVLQASPSPAAGSSPGMEGGLLETGRLQTQLREAYYLLIQAMHDLPPDSGTRRGGPAGARAQGQQPPLPRGAAVRLACSPRGGDRPPRQVSPPRSPLRESRVGLPASPRTRLSSCRSLESLRVSPQPPLLQRWASDSWIRCGAQRDRDEPPPREGGMDGWGRGSHRAAASVALLPPICQDSGRSSERPFRDSAGTSVLSSSQEDRPEEPALLKPPAVTVKKLQKWMYKGRLLSLGMKGRAREAAPKVPGAQATSPNLGSWKVHENHVLSVTADQRITLTDLFENVYGSPLKKREPEDAKDTASLRGHRPLNNITVSKKRNWLYQSTLRSQSLEESKRCQDRTYFSLSPVSPPRHQLWQPFCKSPEGHCTHAVCNAASSPLSRDCSLDFSEDNDADDEGEIWYNPIPEDDDLGIASVLSLEEANTAGLKLPALSVSVLSARDLMKAESHSEELLCPSQHTGDVQAAHSNGINSVDSTHSTEVTQQGKQRLGHRTQEGVTAEDSPVLKSAFTGPGILVSTHRTELRAMEPSFPSPSPVKKGSSITWSLPDKIKSPRTVRKLSMKMKRLPEFSRKLGARGASHHVNSPDSSPSLSKCSCREIPHSVILPSGNPTRNVISRYHLDTTVSSQHSHQKKVPRSSKYSCKGGYLSDGDSPELRAKSGKHGAEHKVWKGREPVPSSCSKGDIDTDAFRHYSFADQARCSQYISGLLSVHFYGAEGLKPPRIDSKDVFCAIQVDSVNKARTALLTCRTTFLDMDHTFNIEIENAQHLKLVVFSWEPTPRRNRVCCHGTVVLPTLFRGAKTHQLAVKLEPRGLIYVKLTLMEQWENSLHGLDKNRESVMFGVDIQKVVEKENVGSMVPLLIQKCIVEIEKRGCQVVGLYRLCGSAAVKKELREAFEKDSKTVGLCENQYPDINVITGVLKDYLRELPSPLITKQLYEAVLDAMVKSPLKMSLSGCENESSDSKLTVDLLNCLPDVEKATLKMLLDHLKLVASHHEVNKMTCQNLAVCFGPVLLNQRQETSTHNRVFTDSEELANALDFKKHIEVLHYLLQLWPVQRLTVKGPTDSSCLEQPSSLNYLRRKKERRCVLDLSSVASSGVLRPRQVRLDSPLSNRYAGDWSGCGEEYFLNTKEHFKDLDYEDVPLENRENRDYSKMDGAEVTIEQQIPMPRGCTFQTYLTVETLESTVDQKANLRDLQESIDTLIGNLERELNKNKLNLSV
ncbi:rho GTPase-activating protein SYDE2 isoform X2 [Acomys russatus]|uniref:rho GTPase-activating protein SYDE2 isoform X2 n=1 Tax=Acomys russatus TaxID=60746 RepID=UPI0021E2E193|nr:rho GTPase-activating protein SYDE2 isoform X2 [Acomys russatus]